ncbi:MAG TPA: NAD-dependent 4,6-dehydratase LegB [Syntrophorhabdaceae bacterium]|nr:NAD-dependent 4,6-dehydratase LegB [Syntrophorhabdaceae bacterium]
MTGKILVTGADGFIGSHLVEYLVHSNYNVRAFVYYNSFNSWGWLDHLDEETIRSVDIFAGDVRDPYGVKKAVEGCEMVLHLAALIGIPYSYYSPDSYVDTNVRGTLNILQASKESDVKKVIHTSTSEVYGTARFVPIAEDHPTNAQSPYAATKIAGDHLALSFHHSFGTPVAVVRPFNTYGPRQSARAIIPTIINQILSGKGTIQLGSLHPTRDFNYVEDIVRGFVAAIENETCIGEVINLGSGYEVSIGQTAELIAELIGKKIEIITDEQRIRPKTSEVERLIASNAKAKALIGWQPAYSGGDGFRRGLEKTIAWFSNQENSRSYKTDRYTI